MSVLPADIRTARLLLRPFHPQDVEDVMAYAVDEEWARYLPVPQPYTRADAARFLETESRVDRALTPSWAMVWEGHVVGGVNLRIQAEQRLAELGYGMARTLWGRGLATEAVGAVMDAAFRTLPDLNRVRAVADPRNGASQRVMLRLGMTREGVLRQNRMLRGELVDEAWYGILRPEWQVQREPVCGPDSLTSRQADTR